MEKIKKKKVILITAIAVVLALIVITGIILLNQKNTASVNQNDSQNDSSAAIDLSGYPNTGDVIIRSASYLYTADGKIDGYLVTVASKGYKDMIEMDITFDSTGSKVKSVVIKAQNETAGYGEKITEPAFLDQFIGITPPVVLSENNISKSEENQSEDATADNAEDNTAKDDSSSLEDHPLTNQNRDKANTAPDSGVVWADGTYETEEPEFDEQGFKDKVSLTIENGKITDVTWDAYNKDGELKSVLSADGIYEMKPDGLTWQEQALAIADFLIQKQSTDAITMDQDGKTDVVTGVSISVKDFVTLAKECLKQAASKSQENSNAETADTSKDTKDLSDTTDPADTSNTSDTSDTAENTPSSGLTESGENPAIDAVSGATVSSAAVVAGVNKAYLFIQDFVLKK